MYLQLASTDTYTCIPVYWGPVNMQWTPRQWRWHSSVCLCLLGSISVITFICILSISLTRITWCHGCINLSQCFMVHFSFDVLCSVSVLGVFASWRFWLFLPGPWIQWVGVPDPVLLSVIFGLCFHKVYQVKTQVQTNPRNIGMQTCGALALTRPTFEV